MNINLQEVMEIEDLLIDNQTQNVIYDSYLKVIDKIEKSGNIEELKKLYEEMDMTLERLEKNNQQYQKMVKPCRHIKINFGGGYEKCLICETEDQNQLSRIFGNDKISTIYVEKFMKKYGKCFQQSAREKAFTDIKDMFFNLLIQSEQNNTQLEQRKLIYDLAVKTHGYTQQVKKIGSRKIS